METQSSLTRCFSQCNIHMFDHYCRFSFGSCKSRAANRLFNYVAVPDLQWMAEPAPPWMVEPLKIMG